MISELSLTLHVSPDVDDGVVRLDPLDMRLMGVIPGGVVGLAGACTSYARVLPALMGERNQRLALVSPLLSQNIGVQTGHKVQVLAHRAEVPVAERLTLQVEDDLDELHLSVRMRLMESCWHGRYVVEGDWLRVPTVSRNQLFAQIVDLQPKTSAQILSGTQYILHVADNNKKVLELGGLRDAYRTCEKLAVSKFKAGLPTAASSVLVNGPSGCGKSRLVKRLGEALEVPVVWLDIHHLIDKHLLQHVDPFAVSLTDLARRGPAIIALDHLEGLAYRDNSPPSLLASSRLVLSHICALLDEVALHPNLMVFGIGSGEIEPRLTEHQRFDVMLPIDAPNSLERHEILLLATRSLPLAESVDLAGLAESTYGATARDLRQLVSSAFRLSQSAKITHHDFNNACRLVDYSIADDVHCDIPSTSWHDVAGLDDIKQLLKDSLSWSLKHHELFSQAGVSPPRSILLSGGQGTGKTSLVRALVNVVSVNFIEVNCSVLSAYDAVRAERVVHDSFALARRKSPCLVFFDNIDVLFDVHGMSETASPLVPRLLIELDHLSKLPGVVVIAATNRPDRLSSDVLRAGRFDFALTLPMPDAAARKKIFQIHARKLPLASDVDFDRLASLTQGMSPAEIATLCNRVGVMAIRQSLSDEHGAMLPAVASVALFEQVMRARKG